MIEHRSRMVFFFYQQQQGDGLQQRHIPVDLHLQEQVGQLGFDDAMPLTVCGLRKLSRPVSGKGIYRDNASAVRLCSLQALSIRG